MKFLTDRTMNLRKENKVISTHRKVKGDLKNLIDEITEKQWQSRMANSLNARTNKTFETIRSYKKYHYNISRTTGLSLQTHLASVNNRLMNDALLPA